MELKIWTKFLVTVDLSQETPVLFTNTVFEGIWCGQGEKLKNACLFPLWIHKARTVLSFVFASRVLLGASCTSRDSSHNLRSQSRMCTLALLIHSQASGAQNKCVTENPGGRIFQTPFFPFSSNAWLKCDLCSIHFTHNKYLRAV